MACKNLVSDVKILRSKPAIKWMCGTCSVIGNDITTLKNVISELQQEVKTLKELVSKTQVANNLDLTDQVFEEIINEASARERKRKNIIIFNADEHQADNQRGNNDEDLAFVSNLISCIAPNFNHNVDFDIGRLGKFNRTKKRPLKVTLNNEKDVSFILKNTFKLKNLQQFKGISISSDKTKRQIEYYKSVKRILDQRIQNGENVKIKYERGLPIIVENLNA